MTFSEPITACLVLLGFRPFPWVDIRWGPPARSMYLAGLTAAIPAIPRESGQSGGCGVRRGSERIGQPGIPDPVMPGRSVPPAGHYEQHH